jgi:hypothetical protein
MLLLNLVCAGAGVLVPIAFAQTSKQDAFGAANLQELVRAGAG